MFAPEPMTPKLEKLIGKIEAEINSGQVSQTFETADEFLSALKSKSRFSLRPHLRNNIKNYQLGFKFILTIA